MKPHTQGPKGKWDEPSTLKGGTWMLTEQLTIKGTHKSENRTLTMYT